MEMFLTKAALYLFVAFGVVIGGTMLSGIAAVLTLQPPTNTMVDIADKIKIWAVVAAIGGTIDPLRAIETNFLEGHLSPAIKQILYILSGFLGAHLGSELIHWIAGKGE